LTEERKENALGSLSAAQVIRGNGFLAQQLPPRKEYDNTKEKGRGRGIKGKFYLFYYNSNRRILQSSCAGF